MPHRNPASPAPLSPVYDIYKAIGPMQGLERYSEYTRTLLQQKELLRQRHICKTHRNGSLLVTAFCLGGCTAPHNMLDLAVSFLTALGAAVYTNHRNEKVWETYAALRRSRKPLPLRIAFADDLQLNADVARERTPRVLPLRPVRAIGDLFDHFFDTRDCYLR